MKSIKKTKSHCSKCQAEHWGYDIDKDKCQKCSGKLVAGWLNEEHDPGSGSQKQAEAKASWTCPKCHWQSIGFVRGSKCEKCKTRLRYVIGEATLTVCQKCQSLFNFDKQPGASSGAVKCPKCGAVVNQKGKLIGKQSEGLHVKRLPGGGYRLWEKLSPARQKEYDLETAKIKANKETPEALKPHKFQRAQWTFGNGHPRCLLCGKEEGLYGECCGLAMEKDPKAVQAFYDKLQAERKGKGMIPAEELDRAVREWTLSYFRQRLHG